MVNRDDSSQRESPMLGRARGAERLLRDGQACNFRKHKKYTNEANISLKTQGSHRNEAKKYMITKELFDISGENARKLFNSNEISFLKVTSSVSFAV
jgi:hypothetical protein